MAYRDSGLPQRGPYGSTLRSEPPMYLPESPQAATAGAFTGGLLVAVLLVLGLLVGVGTLSVGRVGETPAATGSGAVGSAIGRSGGTIPASPSVAPGN